MTRNEHLHPSGTKASIDWFSRHFPSSSIEFYILIVCGTHIDVCGQLIMIFAIVLQQRRRGHRRFVDTVSLFTFLQRCIGIIPWYLYKTQAIIIKMEIKEVKDKESNGDNVGNVVLSFRRGCLCMKTLIENYHHCTRSQHSISTLLSRRLVCFLPLIFASHITGFCFLREPKLSCHIFWA